MAMLRKPQPGPLAASSFAFNLLLAYLVDHAGKHAAFVASSAVSIALAASYLRLVTGARFVFREAALGQFVYLELFSYAFSFRGFTGLAIATLFIAIQATGRIRWSEAFAAPRHIIGAAGPNGEPPIR